MAKPKDRSKHAKIHPWIKKAVLAVFDELASSVGYSREGALEASMQLFIRKHSRQVTA